MPQAASSALASGSVISVRPLASAASTRRRTSARPVLPARAGRAPAASGAPGAGSAGGGVCRAGGASISCTWLRRYSASIAKACTAASGVSWQAMPSASNRLRASCTAGPPSQQASSRPGCSRSTGSSARAISALGTMAVGACMNSSVPLPRSASSVRSVCT
jgi:hypothetical protein